MTETMTKTTIAAPAAPVTGSSLIARARELQPLVREHARATEDARHLSPEVHRAFIEAGFYRMTMPPEYSNQDGSLSEVMRVLETIAEADASSAWRVWVSLGVPAMSAILTEEGAAEMFSSPDACLSASEAGMGRAVAVDGGYRVSGHWRFMSGIHEATHTGGFSFVYDGAEQRMTPDGQPVVIGTFFPVSDCKVIDVWDTTGLRGTGSNDVVVEDLFVPDRLIADPSKPRMGLPALYYIDEDNAANVTLASIAIGTATAAVDWFREMAPSKRQMDGTLLSESPQVQVALAEVTTRLAAAKGHLYETAEMLWDELVDGTYEGKKWFPRTSLASVAAADAAIDAVFTLYRVAGSAAIFRAGLLDRAMRDLLTLGAHKTVQRMNLLKYGG
jgi:indole-3-acetate monooxygenase